jgi:hypothetical protein
MHLRPTRTGTIRCRTLPKHLRLLAATNLDKTSYRHLSRRL